MNENSDIDLLVQTVRRALPEAAANADAWLRERGFDPAQANPYIWTEALAGVTNGRIQQRQREVVQQHLYFFAAQYARGGEAVRQCITAAYLGNLLLGLDDSTKRWAWALFPKTLQAVYVAKWERPF